MIEDFITISALVSALISVVASLRVWRSASSTRSELVERLLADTEELKVNSVTFSRDNDLTSKEIEALTESITKIQTDLALFQELKKARQQKISSSTQFSGS